MYYPFESRKTLYKSKFGAVASGENLRLRLLLHKDAAVHKAYLRVHPDGCETIIEHEMTPSEYYDEYRAYSCEISFASNISS